MPKAPAAKPEVAVAPVPTNAASERFASALRQQNQAAEISGKSQNIVIGPGGIRREGSKYLGVRVQIGNKTDLLARPEAVIRKDRVKRGGVYMWAKRDNAQTTAFVNCGWYQPVEFEDIDRVPGATVQMVEMPSGPRPEDQPKRYVVDGALMMVWMPQEVHDSIYLRSQEQAWGDQAAMNVSLASRMEQQLGSDWNVDVVTKDASRETVRIDPRNTADTTPQAAAS